MNHTQKKEYRERFKRGFGVTLSFALSKPQILLTKMHFRISMGIFVLTVYFYDFETRIMYLLKNK